MATPTSVRMPVDLREEVTGLARRERRSFSAQIVTLVEAALAALAARATRKLPTHERALLDEMCAVLDAREVDA